MRKWLYKIWCLLISKCPKCGGRLFCYGASETETCMDCNWDEWKDF
jgi:predicted  nucleic acid-binding Zn-ribbon protein